VLVRGLGIMTLDLTPQVAALLPNLRREKGAVVAGVSAAAPFSQQGRLMPGDVIYSLNDKTIDSVATLNSIVATMKPGAPAVLLVERQGTTLYLAFRAERPQ
jgi:serine protease DegQ